MASTTEPVPEMPPVDDREPLPSETELRKLTRADLDELAEERDVDISTASNKEDVIALLIADAG